MMEFNVLNISIVVAIISMLIPILALAFSSIRYVNIKQNEQRQQRFENYHILIHKLVRAGSENRGIESQQAIIFELRNYKEYKEVTARILTDLKEDWGNFPELIKEIKLTLKCLQ